MLHLPKLNTGVRIIDSQWEKLCRKVQAFIEHHPMTLGAPGVRGNVMYASGDRTASLALATTEAASRWIGVLAEPGDDGGQAVMTTSNVERVMLEAGLAPAANQPLYLSATNAGFATNVAPANPNYIIRIGVILDASMYGIATPYVDAILGRCCAPVEGEQL